VTCDDLERDGRNGSISLGIGFGANLPYDRRKRKKEKYLPKNVPSIITDDRPHFTAFFP
jgi:hypothetical protein